MHAWYYLDAAQPAVPGCLVERSTPTVVLDQYELLGDLRALEDGPDPGVVAVVGRAVQRKAVGVLKPQFWDNKAPTVFSPRIWTQQSRRYAFQHEASSRAM